MKHTAKPVTQNARNKQSSSPAKLFGSAAKTDNPLSVNKKGLSVGSSKTFDTSNLTGEQSTNSISEGTTSTNTERVVGKQGLVWDETTVKTDKNKLNNASAATRQPVAEAKRGSGAPKDMAAWAKGLQNTISEKGWTEADVVGGKYASAKGAKQFTYADPVKTTDESSKSSETTVTREPVMSKATEGTTGTATRRYQQNRQRMGFARGNFVGKIGNRRTIKKLTKQGYLDENGAFTDLGKSKMNAEQRAGVKNSQDQILGITPDQLAYKNQTGKFAKSGSNTKMGDEFTITKGTPSEQLKGEYTGVGSKDTKNMSPNGPNTSQPSKPMIYQNDAPTVANKPAAATSGGEHGIKPGENTKLSPDTNVGVQNSKWKLNIGGVKNPANTKAPVSTAQPASQVSDSDTSYDIPNEGSGPGMMGDGSRGKSTPPASKAKTKTITPETSYAIPNEGSGPGMMGDGSKTKSAPVPKRSAANTPVAPQTRREKFKAKQATKKENRQNKKAAKQERKNPTLTNVESKGISLPAPTNTSPSPKRAAKLPAQADQPVAKAGPRKEFMTKPAVKKTTAPESFTPSTDVSVGIGTPTLDSSTWEGVSTERPAPAKMSGYKMGRNHSSASPAKMWGPSKVKAGQGGFNRKK